MKFTGKIVRVPVAMGSKSVSKQKVHRLQAIDRGAECHYSLLAPGESSFQNLETSMLREFEGRIV